MASERDEQFLSRFHQGEARSSRTQVCKIVRVCNQKEYVAPTAAIGESWKKCSLYIKRDNRYTSRIYQIYGKKIDYKKISLLLRYRYYPNTNLNRRLNNET